MSVTPDEAEESSELTTTYGKTQILNIENNVAGLLCWLPICMVNLICSIVVMLTEPNSNYFVRFNAAQSLVLAAAMFIMGIVVGALTMVLGWIPIVGLLTIPLHLGAGLATLAYIVVSVMGMIAAYQRRAWRIPKVAEIADRYVNSVRPS